MVGDEGQDERRPTLPNIKKGSSFVCHYKIRRVSLTHREIAGSPDCGINELGLRVSRMKPSEFDCLAHHAGVQIFATLADTM